MALTKITDKQVTYKQGATGSEVRNLGDKLREIVSVLDFGADPTGTVDSYAAITAAIASVGEAGEVYFPAGVYLVSDTIEIIDTNPYPAAAHTGNHFITLRGDGPYAMWFVHTGTQTTGCVRIEGNANWFSTAYQLLNNGSSNVRDMALKSSYSPALHCKFANKMLHNNLLLYSTGAAAKNLVLELC